MIESFAEHFPAALKTCRVLRLRLLQTRVKVLLLTNEYPPHIYGGAGVHVEFLSRELANLMDVEVRCFGDQKVDRPHLKVRGLALPRACPAGSALRQTRIASADDAAAGPTKGVGRPPSSGRRPMDQPVTLQPPLGGRSVTGWSRWLLLLGGRSRGRGLVGGPVAVAALEALDAATGVDQLLLAGEERVALVAELHAELLPGGPGDEGVPARAADGRGLVLGVDIGSHGCILPQTDLGPKTRRRTTTQRATAPWRSFPAPAL